LPRLSSSKSIHGAHENNVLIIGNDNVLADPTTTDNMTMEGERGSEEAKDRGIESSTKSTLK
jgi:hypothetical protein